MLPKNIQADTYKSIHIYIQTSIHAQCIHAYTPTYIVTPLSCGRDSMNAAARAVWAAALGFPGGALPEIRDPFRGFGVLV